MSLQEEELRLNGKNGWLLRLYVMILQAVCAGLYHIFKKAFTSEMNHITVERLSFALHVI